MLYINFLVTATDNRKFYAIVIGGSSSSILILSTTSKIYDTVNTILVQMNEKTFAKQFVLCLHSLIVRVVLAK